jgi:hypothetical protein
MVGGQAKGSSAERSEASVMPKCGVAAVQADSHTVTL